MKLFKKEKESNHVIPLDQIPYNAKAIQDKLKKREQKRKIIKNVFTVIEGCLGALAIFLVFSYWSSKKTMRIEWSQLQDRFASQIKMCVTVFRERIDDNYSSIIKQLVAIVGRDANTRINVGIGQIQSRFRANSLMIAMATSIFGSRISRKYNSGVWVRRINDVIAANLWTVVHGISHMYNKLVLNGGTLYKNWSVLKNVLKDSWNKLASFVIKR